MREDGTLELVLSEGRNGFRLDRVELYNWGTFDGKVWSFPICGENALITGDIGSGKSTWVDALTSLLVPPQRITYNKAAGAEKRERTDKSYLLGEYMSSREVDSTFAKPINLRGGDQYSVILGVFKEKSDSRMLSLAQLRWLKGGEIQRLYVVSGKPLSVMVDFHDFDGNGSDFKKKLRALSGAETFDSFSDYYEAFRESMGITEKAIDLFNQTISMKTIGDLDDFIRNHMLERTKARDNVERLLRNYDNLRSAHDSVARAREQREALRPIAKEAEVFVALDSSLTEFLAMLDGLPYWAISLELPLLIDEAERLEEKIKAAADELARLDSGLKEERERAAMIRSDIDNSETGRRIAELDTELDRVGQDRDRRHERAHTYGQMAEVLKLDEPMDVASFLANRERAEKALGRADREAAEKRLERDDYFSAKLETQGQAQKIEEELESLRMRTTSIPSREFELRAAIAQAVGAEAEELPFAGELLRVREADRAWEGAAERVLRSFALSVLVPERLYRKTSAYVCGRDLEDRRLVFYRVPEKALPAERVGDRSLARAVEVKSDSPFRIWLESELTRRAAYERCESLEEFYRAPDAVTLEGLVKSGKIRHEKDDRRRVADPRYYVLGWSNKEKIALLEKDLAEKRTALAARDRELAACDRAIESLGRERDAARGLSSFSAFEEIDWRAQTKRYQALRSERDELERSSDQLAKLREAFALSNAEIDRLQTVRDGLLTQSGGFKNELASFKEDIESKKRNLSAAPADLLERVFVPLQDFSGKAPGTLRELRSGWQEGVRQKITSRRNTVERKSSDVRSSLTRLMTQYISTFTEESASLAVGVEFLEDYRKALERIEKDDLPAYENRFRALLRESTLQDIALFQNELEKDAEAIKDAIEAINNSLRAIEYNRGTYISLSMQHREDQDIKEFRADLIRCLENTLDDELYGEGKFLQVKKLLDRFASGETLDRQWTDHVTDVRAWFAFTASERWDADGTEKEFYSSSSGKSGGQKEKLAYTILASALAYQYNLGRRRRVGGFRLVVIDEAFGRGSEDSTEYGLKLFKELDLQLVLVTPIQKIGVIEEYVSSIHFVANPEGKASEVHNLTIEAYREQKQARQADDSIIDKASTSVSGLS